MDSEEKSGEKDLSQLADFIQNAAIQEISGSEDFAIPSIEAPPPESISEFVSLESFGLLPPESAIPEPAETLNPSSLDDSIIDSPLNDFISITNNGEKLEKQTSSLQSLKQFSDQVSPIKEGLAAGLPFSLKITGQLTDTEKQKLLDIISQEKLGIREVDLENAFVSGKILLPRMSEYAGILIIQYLRGTEAKFELNLSDLIFSGSQINEVQNELQDWGQESPQSTEHDCPDSVFGLTGGVFREDKPQTEELGFLEQDPKKKLLEEIPISTTAWLDSPRVPPLREDFYKLQEIKVAASFDSGSAYELIDTVLASGVLSAESFQDQNSFEYLKLLSSLQNELRHKAYYLKASGLVCFQLKTEPFESHSVYRVLASALAVRKKSQN